MRKLLSILSVIMAVFVFAQDRIDTAPTSLTWKSKEITKGLYWQKNNKNGKWESRKNDKLVYLGEGVRCPNFISLFMGEIGSRKYFFCDRADFYWEYPNIKKQWMRSPFIYQILLSDEDYERLENLDVNEKYIVSSGFAESMNRNNSEYSFPFFLELNETLMSTGKEGKKIPQLIFKRYIDSKGRDVVRFALPGEAILDMIDSWYFEVDYNTYRLLFTADNKLLYK